ncbi:protein-L-isoaspartate(D-aspartate) O-methyltransferase [Mangrovitalea sediminis]|uniref:protein-L-isoaspartate(D-aspartate) O-methyltransferase n=1 Tax=Mangrovitalea sediminis TaxID=1982043 RepID=UPI000BE62607|nr:protein-L-isoaspartate(D-aspartate) O-methyltransferase [Mangrovitalea sediminis]
MNASLEGIGMTSRRTRQRLIQRLQESGIRDQRVLDVIMQTPRHIFLDEALSHRAYEDTALPIGYNQTLSQPYIVARMTELMMAHQPRRVLEIGTGSGYQTAVLAQLATHVYSLERIKPLQDRARDRLAQLRLSNVSLRHADGGVGWPEAAPFEGILITAAPTELPRGLMSQLADGGVMILPLGDQQQTLTRVTRRGDDFSVDAVEPVRFVPLLGGVIR